MPVSGFLAFTVVGVLMTVGVYGVAAGGLAVGAFALGSRLLRKKP